MKYWDSEYRRVSGLVVPHLNFLEFSSDVHDTFLRIARSYERRIRTGGVTRTGQARLQHHGQDERHLIAERTQRGARTISRDAATEERRGCLRSLSAVKISGHHVIPSPWTLARRLGWKPGVESRLCPHLLALGRADGARQPALGRRAHHQQVLQPQEVRHRPGHQDLGFFLFLRRSKRSNPGPAVYRHSASAQPIRSKKRSS